MNMSHVPPLNITENLVDNHRFKALTGWCFKISNPSEKGHGQPWMMTRFFPVSQCSMEQGHQSGVSPSGLQWRPHWGILPPEIQIGMAKVFHLARKVAAGLLWMQCFQIKHPNWNLFLKQKYFLGRAQSIVAVDIEGFQLMCGCMACFWKVSSTLSVILWQWPCIISYINQIVDVSVLFSSQRLVPNQFPSYFVLLVTPEKKTTNFPATKCPKNPGSICSQSTSLDKSKVAVVNVDPHALAGTWLLLAWHMAGWRDTVLQDGWFFWTTRVWFIRLAHQQFLNKFNECILNIYTIAFSC